MSEKLDEIFSSFEDEEKEEEKPKETVPSGQPESTQTGEGARPDRKEAPSPEEAPAPKEDDIGSFFGEPSEEEPVEEKPVVEEKPAETGIDDWFTPEPEKEVPPKEEEPVELEEIGRPTISGLPKEEDFDYSDAEGTGKDTYMYYGFKGEGKTTLAFSHPGKIVCLSFDQKAEKIKEKMFNNDPRIIVKDVVKHLSMSSPTMWLETADVSFRYIDSMLDKEVRGLEPDWIVIDGLEIFVRDICEMTMRVRNNLKPFEGFANLNLWKERNMYVNQVYNTSLRIAKKGVIFTAYVKDTVMKIAKGKIIEQKRQPKWAAETKTKADTVIRVEAKDTDEGRRFYAFVESSKTHGIRTGVRADITGVQHEDGTWTVEGIKKVREAS